MTRGFNRAEAARATLARGLATLGVGIGVSAFVGATKAAIAFGDALGDLSAQTGISAERLQQLRHTAQLTGSSAEVLDRSMQIFARGLGQAAAGTGALKAALEANGIAIRDSAGAVRDTADVLDEYIKAASEVESAAERAQLAQAAFGKGGVELTGILSLTTEQLRAYAAETSTVSDEQVAALSRAQDAIDRFSDRLHTGFVVAVGESILIGEDFIHTIQRMAGAADATRLEELAAKQFELSAAMDAAAQAAASGDVVAKARLETLRMEAQALVDEMAALQAVERATTGLHKATGPLLVDIHKQSEATEDAAAATTKLAAAERNLLTQFRSDPEGDRRVRQLRAQQNAHERMTERLKEQEQLSKSLAAEQERALASTAEAERWADAMTVPLTEAGPEVQRELAEAFELAFAS